MFSNRCQERLPRLQTELLFGSQGDGGSSAGGYRLAENTGQDFVMFRLVRCSMVCDKTRLGKSKRATYVEASS
jgi:hypothetical protein